MAAVTTRVKLYCRVTPASLTLVTALAQVVQASHKYGLGESLFQPGEDTHQLSCWTIFSSCLSPSTHPVPTTHPLLDLRQSVSSSAAPFGYSDSHLKKTFSGSNLALIPLSLSRFTPNACSGATGPPVS